MIKEVKTAKEFNDACKEYYKYHHSRYLIGESEQCSPNLIEGISLMINKPKQFTDKEYRNLFSHNNSILDESLPLLGKECYIKNSPEERGKFIGIEATEEDFYYVLENEEGYKFFESCVGSIIECEKN